MPDLTHPERVAAAVPDDCKVVALLHDAVEDGHLPMRAALEGLRESEAKALVLLTRIPDEKYASYIACIASAAGIARAVKIADLRDNLYGRPEGPPPDSLRRRYERALAVLEAHVDEP